MSYFNTIANQEWNRNDFLDDNIIVSQAVKNLTPVSVLQNMEYMHFFLCLQLSETKNSGSYMQNQFKKKTFECGEKKVDWLTYLGLKL